nr:restriction endonuclease subunit S [Nostoc commune]
MDDNREFKDSALGIIPKDWEVIRLEKILLEFINGYAFKSEEYQEFGYPIIRMTNISIDGNFQIIKGSIKYCSFDDYRKLCKYHVFQGDLIIAMTDVTPNKGIIGRSVIVNIEEKFLLNQRVGLLRINLDKIDIRFLQKFTNSHHFREYSKSTSGASAQANLSTSDIKKAFIFLPPIREQQQIAKILDTVDKAIAQTETLIAKYKRVKTGLMQDLLTRGIDEHGQLREPKTHKFKRSPLGMIPDEWNIVTLDTLCNKITDGSHQSVKTSDHGVPFLYVSCIRDGKILWEETSKISEETYTLISKGREPLPGLILYTAVGSYGHAALVRDDKKFSFQRHIAYILPDPKKINSEYLTFWLNTNQSKQYADQVAIGNAQKTVTLGEITKFPILVPKIKEQNYIVEIITKIDKYLTHEENYKKKLQVQKTGLMQDLLTGKSSVKPLLTNQP